MQNLQQAQLAICNEIVKAWQVAPQADHAEAKQRRTTAAPEQSLGSLIRRRKALRSAERYDAPAA